jgi:hypothetical protein
MAILLKNGAVFLHAPKCGGDWVTRVLKATGLHAGRYYHKHAGYERVALNDPTPYVNPRNRNMPEPLPDDTFYFTFVRHPLSWLESLWRWIGDNNGRDWGSYDSPRTWHPKATLNGLWTRDFNQWVRRVETARPGYATETLYRFAHPRVNFVGRQESLRDDLLRVLRIMGIDVDAEALRGVAPANRSKTRVQYWDKATRDMATRYERAGIRGLGYE